MPKGIRDLFWADKKNVELFRDLCKRSEGQPIIKWKKFRRLDKDDVFKDILNTQMISTWRKMRLLDKGICPKCGKYYLEEDQKICSICVENQKKYIYDFLERKKTHIGSNAKDMIKDMEKKEPSIRKTINKIKSKK